MKKTLVCIVCYVVVLILSACSNDSNSSSSFEYKDYGLDCCVSGCWNKAADSEVFCSKHMAERNGEIDLCKYNVCTSEAYSDGYCATHKVSQANEGYYTCIREGCMRKAEEDSIYCAWHS